MEHGVKWINKCNMHDTRVEAPLQLSRAGVRRCSLKKLFLKFQKIGKHLCWSLILIKLQPFRPTTLLKRDSNTGVFL